MNKELNPAVEDLQEMDVLRFLFELKRQQVDPLKLQEMLLTHQVQKQVLLMAQQQQAIEEEKNRKKEGRQAGSSTSSLSTPPDSATSSPRAVIRNEEIPAPSVIFQFGTKPVYPTPSPTPEPLEPTEQAEAIDYSKTDKKGENFGADDRSYFIKLQEAAQSEPSTSSASQRGSDTEMENVELRPLRPIEKHNSWCGNNIYSHLPELVMTEFDKMMRESHSLKVKVLQQLNAERPVTYDYNPNKSRVRVDYAKEQIADERIKNNILSRRSRQRKKFQTQIIQYSVDYDIDENLLLSKQEEWLMSIIAGMEQKALENGSDKIKKLRRQCGFE